MSHYPRPFYKSTRLRHFAAGALASFLLVSFFVGMIGCDRTGMAQTDDDAQRGVDVEVDVRPAPCDSTRYDEPPVTERRDVDPTGNVRVRVTVRTCCCCCGHDEHAHSGYVPPYPITGTGPGGQPGPPRPSVTPPAEAPPVVPPVATLPPVRALPPVSGGFPGGVPVEAPGPLPPVATSNVPWWISLVAAPLALLSLDDSEDFPDGILCGDDSGLPTGPTRPRCN